LLAREPRHLFDGLEFLALHHLELAQNALGLGAKERVELTPNAGSDAGRIVHQPRDLVEKAVLGLGHGTLRAPARPRIQEWRSWGAAASRPTPVRGANS